jgi:ABC-type glutathione transport system ATPase component
VLSTIDPDAPKIVDPADIGTETHGGVFVGRKKEMDQLRSIFEETLSGRGSLVALVGEPGIGKTRIAQELAGYAGLRGARVLWGVVTKVVALRRTGPGCRRYGLTSTRRTAISSGGRWDPALRT